MADKKAFKPTVAINVSAKGGSSIPTLEPGTYNAICYGIANLGTVSDTYKNKPVKSVKVRIFFELTDELIDIDGKMSPRHISKEYTASLSDKANLTKDLQSWRGKNFTAEELEKFDIVKLLTQPCMLSIINKESGTSGKVYANISGISKPMKNTKAGELHEDTEIILFAYELPKEELIKAFLLLPEFVQDTVVTTPEWKALKIDRPVATGSTDEAAPNDEVADATNTADEDEPPF